MSEYWFKPKTYGYGATPSHWKGWAVTVGFAVAVIAASLALVALPISNAAGPTFVQIAVWAALVVSASLGFAIFARAKTDGTWKWR